MSGLCLLVPSVPSAAAPGRSLTHSQQLGALVTCPWGQRQSKAPDSANTATLGDKTARGKWISGAAGSSSRGTRARARSAKDRREAGSDDGAETKPRGKAPCRAGKAPSAIQECPLVATATAAAVAPVNEPSLIS